MNKLYKKIEGHCNNCNINTTFRYVSSTRIATRKELQHYYSHDCGETHPLEYFATLRNLHNIVVSKKR